MPLPPGTTVPEAELKGAEQCTLAAVSIAVQGYVSFDADGCVLAPVL